jgi:nitrite reductase/ring-hydroxylating ferredoxin subunit
MDLPWAKLEIYMIQSNDSGKPLHNPDHLDSVLVGTTGCLCHSFLFASATGQLLAPPPARARGILYWQVFGADLRPQKPVSGECLSF